MAEYRISGSLVGPSEPGSYVLGAWLQDGTFSGHTNVAKSSGKDVKFQKPVMVTAGPTEEVKFCVYTVPAENAVTKDNYVGSFVGPFGDLTSAERKTLTLDTGAELTLTAVDVAAAAAAKEKAKQSKKKGSNKGKKEEKPKGPSKAMKAAIKEGGKKGQDICGMSSFGVHHFCVTLESIDADWELMEGAMEGMNKDVDPEAEDRKGGAKDLGKLLFSANDNKLIMYCHLPVEAAGEKCTLTEFFSAVCDPIGAKIYDQTEFFAKAEVIGDPDANKYPLKMRDVAIAAGFQFLREKGLVLDDDSDDDDINFADDCGIDLNGGAEGDY